MPVYRFRIVSGKTQSDEKIRFEDDEAALLSAKQTLADLSADALTNARPVPEAIEVIREDDVIVGLVVPD